MKATLLSFIGLAAIAVLAGCGGGGGGGGNNGSGGGGGTPTAVAGSYRLVAIPLLTGTTNTANAINRAGQVIGTSGAAGSERAFYWDATNGLVSLHGAGNPADATSFGLGINARGEGVGLLVAPSLGFSRGFYALQSGGGFVVSNGDTDSAYSSANALNNAGTIAGTRGASFDTRYAAVFTTAGGSDRLTIGGSITRVGESLDVNETNDVAGYASDSGRVSAFYRLAGQEAVLVASPNAGENQSFTGINSARNFCGNRGSQAIYMAAGTQPTIIGGLTGATFSQAHDISDGNIVVGHSNFGTLDRAFAWSSTSGMIDLQTRLDSSGAGWTLNRANGVAGNGRIVGVGTFNGVPRAFMLIPN